MIFSSIKCIKLKKIFNICMSNRAFSNLVIDILATSRSSKGSQDEISLGDNLYDEYSSRFLSNFIGLSGSKGKLVTVFYKGKRLIFSIEKQRTSLKITFNAKLGTLTDERGLLRDVSKIGHWGSGDYQIKLNNMDYFDYCCDLIRQIY
jgi:predicted transport protein